MAYSHSQAQQDWIRAWIAVKLRALGRLLISVADGL